LKTTQLNALSSTSVAALTTVQVQALVTAQVVGLSTSVVAALTTTQIQAIETRDIAALTTSSMGALTTAQTVALTTAQLSAMTTFQTEAFSSAAIQALTTVQLAFVSMSTPLILDLNGDGVKTLDYASGVKFDIYAEGKEVRTGWVSSDDGLLVLDRNNDGKINDGSELFGSSTTLANGSRASDGYEALRELDSNLDGVISAEDAGFADLGVWVDANSDGLTDAGEIRSLTAMGITRIDLIATATSVSDSGNIIGLTSSYQTVDGTQHDVADVWFKTDAPINPLHAVAAPTGADGDTPQPDAPPDLRSKVSGLTQSINNYSGDGAPGSGVAQGLQAVGNAGVAAGASVTTVAVSSMANVLNQFDARGQLLSSSGSAAGTAKPGLNVPGLPDPLTGGYLASGA